MDIKTNPTPAAAECGKANCGECATSPATARTRASPVYRDSVVTVGDIVFGQRSGEEGVESLGVVTAISPYGDWMQISETLRVLQRDGLRTILPGTGSMHAACEDFVKVA